MNPTTICVVDDDEAVRDSLGLLLESAGYATVMKESGEAVLGDPEMGGYGCVVLDLRLPDVNGLDLLIELRRRYRGLPIIMVTGHGDVPLAVEAMKRGALDFIEKPYSDDVLLGRIGQAVDGRQVLAVDNAEAAFATLTPREHDVFLQLVIGRPNKLIARELGISPRTVEIHRARVMEKSGADSLSHLVRMALAAEVDLDNVRIDRA